MLASPMLAVCPLVDFKVVPQNLELNVSKGSSGQFTLLLQNNGNARQYLDIVATPPEGLRLSFDELLPSFIDPGQEKVVHLNVFTESAFIATFEIPIFISISGLQACDRQILKVNVREPPALSQEQVIVSMAPSGKLVAISGEELQFEVLVKNNLNERLFADFAVDGAFKASTDFEATQAELKAFESRYFKVRISIPPGTSPSSITDTFDSVIKITTTAACCRKEFLFPVQIQLVEKTTQLQFESEPTISIVKHNQQKDFQIVLKNNGETNEFDVELETPDEVTRQAVKINTEALHLNSGEKRAITLSISVTPSMPAGDYRYYLKVKRFDKIVAFRNYALQIVPLYNATLSMPPLEKIPIEETKVVGLQVKNIGTTVQNFTVSSAFVPGIEVLIAPAKISLNPSVIRNISIIITPKNSTLTGVYSIPLTLSGKNVEVKSNFQMQVLPANAFVADLNVKVPQSISIASNEPQDVFIEVQNLLDIRQEVELDVQGIPGNWFAMEGGKRIAQKGVATFRISVNAKEVGNYPLKIIATVANGKRKAAGAVLKVEEPREQLSFDSYVERIVQEGEVVGAKVTISLYNNGNVPISNIKSILSEDERIAFYTSDPEITVLNPKSGALVTVYATPLKSVGAKSIPLTIQTSRGELKQKIELPALSVLKEEQGLEWYWILLISAAIVALIILIGLFVRKHESHKFEYAVIAKAKQHFGTHVHEKKEHFERRG